MAGKQFVRLREIEAQLHHLTHLPHGAHWVTIGIVAERSSPRDSKNGRKFMTVKLTDLNDLTVHLFLFEEAYQKHKTVTIGSIVALLNAEALKPTEVGLRWMAWMCNG